MLRGFGVAALGSTSSAAGNKALTSADVQLVCTLSDALKRSAATALAQSTAATLTVERACASAEHAISDFARRARSKETKQLVETQRRLARSMQTRARELSQKIGVDARLYALEAAQRAGKMDDMVQLFATYNGNPGTGKVCIVTGAAATRIAFNRRRRKMGEMGQHAEKMQGPHCKRNHYGRGIGRSRRSSQHEKEAVHDGRRAHHRRRRRLHATQLRR
ncbi:putative Trypanosome variant surface glycoprotein (A type) [Trypanosoma vivax]|nr:putative Trypanosome variant surface glycoprotein (A type) [Trypanosoma vivax]